MGEGSPPAYPCRLMEPHGTTARPQGDFSAFVLPVLTASLCLPPCPAHCPAHCPPEALSVVLTGCCLALGFSGLPCW